MNRRRMAAYLGCLLPILGSCAPAFAALPPAHPSAPAEPARPTFARSVAPVLARYCAKCHGGAKPKAGLDLTAFSDEAAALKQSQVWEKVADSLRSGDMPPPGRPRP